MNLAMWEPFMSSDSIERVVGDIFGPNASKRLAESVQQWRPAADLASDENGYTVRFDVPCVSKDAIDISIEERVLTVSGERTDTFESDEKSNVYRRETFHGKFSRAFRLPEDADVDSVTARHVDGVLEVRISKSAQAQARRVEIGTA